VCARAGAFVWVGACLRGCVRARGAWCVVRVRVCVCVCACKSEPGHATRGRFKHCTVEALRRDPQNATRIANNDAPSRAAVSRRFSSFLVVSRGAVTKLNDEKHYFGPLVVSRRFSSFLVEL